MNTTEQGTTTTTQLATTTTMEPGTATTTEQATASTQPVNSTRTGAETTLTATDQVTTSSTTTTTCADVGGRCTDAGNCCNTSVCVDDACIDPITCSNNLATVCDNVWKILSGSNSNIGKCCSLNSGCAQNNLRMTGTVACTTNCGNCVGLKTAKIPNAYCVFEQNGTTGNISLCQDILNDYCVGDPFTAKGCTAILGGVACAPYAGVCCSAPSAVPFNCSPI